LLSIKIPARLTQLTSNKIHKLRSGIIFQFETAQFISASHMHWIIQYACMTMRPRDFELHHVHAKIYLLDETIINKLD
jgi:hypothetical protein